MIYLLQRTDTYHSNYNDLMQAYPELLDYNVEEFNEDYFDEYGDQQTRSYCTIDLATLDQLPDLIHSLDHNVMICERPDWDHNQEPYTHTLTIMDDSLYY